MGLYAGLLKTPLLDQNGTVSRAWWLALQDLGVADNNDLQTLLEGLIGAAIEPINSALMDIRKAETDQHAAELDQLRAEINALRNAVQALTEATQPQPEPGIVREFGTMAEQQAANVAITGGSVSSATISGGTINNTTIGATTATTGRFSTVQTTGTVLINKTVDDGLGVLQIGGNTSAKAANPAFYLTGNKSGGNQWLMQTVDSDGRYRIYDGTSSVERFSVSQSGNTSVTGSATVSGAFGCNGASAKTSHASGGAVSSTAATNAAPYGYTTAAQADGIVTLLNNIRAALVANGIMS